MKTTPLFVVSLSLVYFCILAGAEKKALSQNDSTTARQHGAGEGIAANYADDVGIEQDKAVLFAEGFENGRIPTVGYGKVGGFYDLQGHPRLMRITNAEAAVGKHSLELTHPAGVISPQWMHRRFPGTDTIYVRFYRKFARDWVWPPRGAHDTMITAGRYDNPASTDLSLYLDLPQGPSHRTDKGSWDLSRKPELVLKSSFQGPGLDFGFGRPIVSHVGWDNYYSMPYNVRPAPVLEGGRWYCFEYMAKMNSEPDKKDGEIRLWVDGKLITQMGGVTFGKGKSEGLLLRNATHRTIQWDHWMLAPRYGGGGPKGGGPRRTQRSWIDAIVVSRKYIGPAKKNESRSSTGAFSRPPAGNADRVVRLSAGAMRDKIKGGWAGQTIGCAYGAPTEFRWLGRYIPDRVPIEWNDRRMLHYFRNSPGVYDDIYVDLTFLSVLDQRGLDAPAEALARKFANANYRLWHANQIARLNIRNGIMPPASGHYTNNPHADDIDFQIESDFIGLICPGMPATAFEYADRVGHIMNYGDGFYGGVFVSAMYSHAFVEQDVETVVTKALQSLPPESNYARCIRDVVGWWKQFPDDWHRCWTQVQEKWAGDVGCPECVLQPGNIDAKLNGAYIVIGLLYGRGDFGRTIDIATRCGQDSDCNPSSAGGILGTMIGFSAIPARWKQGLENVEKLKFSDSPYSLHDVYDVNYRLAAELVRRGGGRVGASAWAIRVQVPKAPTRVEIAFEGLKPVRRIDLKHVELRAPFRARFTGAAFVIHGRMKGFQGDARCEVRIDGRQIEQVSLKGNLHEHRFPFFWNYDLTQGEHDLEIRKLSGNGVPQLGFLVIYERVDRNHGKRSVGQ